jgi:hypothetical protein
MNHATILCCPQVTPLDARLARLAEFLGIECRVQTVSEAVTGPADRAWLSRDHHCLMLSATTVEALAPTDADRAQVLQRLLDRTRHLLVYGFRATTADAAAARALSQGLVESVSDLPPGGGNYTISPEWRSLTREFTGLTFGPARAELDCVFSGHRPAGAVHAVISIEGSPSFATFTRGGCRVFMLGCSDIADLDAPINDELRVVEWFSRVIPGAMFLRHAFGRHAWHNPRPSASFIIDDLLLKESYGFLNYRQLLHATRDQAFAATIAFIPYNFRRSQASVVELFRSHPGRLALCIHGCDHTGGEFATADLPALNAMAGLADDRMRAHQKATGLPYGKIMVFPQGRFSTASLKALQGNGYLAAVNTTPIPEDADPRNGLSLREWLDVAVTRYHGFPLFVRRYPGDLVNFAFDLFLGKTLLVVEHHTAFRNGYREIAEFVAALNSLNPEIRWGSLQDAVSRSPLERDLSHDTVGVRLWTNYGVLSNGGARSRHYVVQKAEDADAPIRQVLVDGAPAQYVVDKGLLKVELDIPPLSARVLEISHYATRRAVGRRRVGLRAALGIHARRRLSELRDDLLPWQQQLQTLAGLRGGPPSR